VTRGPALAPGKGKDKQAHVVPDNDEVLSDEDEPLQKQLWLSSGVGGSSGSATAAPDVAAATDKVAVDKRAVEEAAVKAIADKEAMDKGATEEAVVKEVAVGGTGDSSAPG
jgi:hypothetical protein